jgi:hypothetical protein
MPTKTQQKRNAAKRVLPYIQKLVARFGFDSVRYVVNDLSKRRAIERELAATQKRAEQRIAELKKKLS